ncbi:MULTISPECIES: deoxyribose-phosphate aldolase [unclassified Nocardioides]|uniref:deoxyribose-phosphate aldolase n=1 Tax=unclassified Nocardioides TaxID=2615069 RepID=UPI0000570EE8|nr:MULTISPECIES: deoxyribose-phosphate aldolase [unclassified Nocardioides]ABL80086.1 deoxyribose-phosphate aldolase [Nocardioides sp. JS614]
MTEYASLTPAELAPYIQHTLIAVGTTREQTIAHAQQCVEHGFDAAMVAGSWVGLTAEVLAGTGITVASALDFPTVGVMTSAGKAAEAAELVRLGARELDIGVQVGWLRSGDHDAFREDIAGVVRAAGVPVKVMLELPLLTPSERDAAVDLACEAGAAYLKNASSGAIEVASPASIRYLVDRAPAGVLVKASGGIKSRDQIVALLEAGAAKVGTSAGVEVVTDSADEDTESY